MKRRRASPAYEIKVEDNEYTYDDEEEDQMTNGYLQEADVSTLPAHLFRNLKKIKCTPGEGEELTAEELISAANEGGEVWIIQCPRNVNPAAVFSGKKLSLEDDDISILNTLSDPEDLNEIMNKPKHLIKKRKTKYEALTLSDSGSTNSIMTMVPDSEGNRRIVAAPLTGSIMIRESIEDAPIVTFIKKEKAEKKILPPDLKHHHPIYGVDFSHAENMECHTDSEEDTKKSKRSSKNQFLEPLPVKKKKKKKKNKHDEFETDETQDESMSESHSVYSNEEEMVENNHVKKKKSKKRKREGSEQSNYLSSECYTESEQEEFRSPKKKKHKKCKYE